MNMKDDLITQIYNILSMGVDIADGIKYDHNITDVSLTNDNEITVWAEDYDGEMIAFKLKLKINE